MITKTPKRERYDTPLTELWPLVIESAVLNATQQEAKGPEGYNVDDFDW